jgi:hypothetical protein
MKTLTVMALATLFIAASASAATVEYGWEDGGVILGSYGDIDASSVTTPDPVHGGSHSLYLLDQAASGTPQAYIAWVKGLSDGDEVTASFWRYDDTPGASPSCRIWGHWNDEPLDVMGFAGSAGGNNDYGLGEGWGETSWTWTVADGHTGLVIEVRTYSNPGDFVWVDDLTVTSPGGSEIVVPLVTPVAESTWSAIKALYGNR